MIAGTTLLYTTDGFDTFTCEDLSGQELRVQSTANPCRGFLLTGKVGVAEWYEPTGGLVTSVQADPSASTNGQHHSSNGVSSSVYDLHGRVMTDPLELLPPGPYLRVDVTASGVRSHKLVIAP